MPIEYTARTRMLFIGDSITDCGRFDDPESVGFGYVRLIRDHLRAKQPIIAPQVVNRGISGNKITDLQARWRADVIDERPDVLSVMIGINDVWHRLAGLDSGVRIDQFERVYRELLVLTHEILPKCQIILCQPSIIVKPAPANGNAQLEPYVEAVNRIAGDFSSLPPVPVHTALLAARHDRPDIDWTPDGVHPSTSGHAVIARTWLEIAEVL